MSPETAKRLLEIERTWTCGTGEQGRNGGKKRAAKKARAHQSRLIKLERIASGK
jgi:hypothetical protein